MGKMKDHDKIASTAFCWKGGGWFGGQLGGTLWLLICGLVFLAKDILCGLISIACFILLNAFGLYLWRQRARLSAYKVIQSLLAITAATVILLVVMANLRGIVWADKPGGLVSTYLPYSMIFVVPTIMARFYFQERNVRNKGE
jgi:hypothetical protein